MLHNSKFTTVLVFGVFDGLHKGHKFFLTEAKKLGDFLTVVLAEDQVVKKIKNKLPRQNFNERKKILEKESYVDEVLAGDNESDRWEIFEKIQPDIIALGYDQSELKKSLENYFLKSNWQPKIKTIKSFEPEKYKSSLLKS